VTDRPDPDLLLKKVEAAAARARRACLKIYFGFAPGVGKTYRMLQVARELRAQGVEILVGNVETHGRYDTASLLLGLDILPRREIEYRGRVLSELDVDAALARRPHTLLVDELAHTNAPGLRHARRWQDVMELLDAGIEVHTTLNVQHVESLNDVIAQITGIRVRETVPDAVLERADEIELIDISPEELLQRLREGKVYFPEQAENAARHFFRRGNLLALRELALRRTAERVDLDVRAYREENDVRRTWGAAERVLVCVSSAPTSARLVRAGCRIAAGLRAPWLAVHVEETGQPPLSDPEQDRLDAHLHLVEELGGQAIRLTGESVGRSVMEYAERHHVTRIVVGKPSRRRWRDRLRASLLDDLVRFSGTIDVHVVSGDEPVAPEEKVPRPAMDRTAVSVGAAIAAVAAATIGGWTLRAFLELPDLAMLYLTVITLVALRLGQIPSLVAAALSVAAYDVFFVPPYGTFAVGDTRHLLTFVTMFAVGVLISGLTLRLRRQGQQAREREARTAALYALSRELGAAADVEQATTALARHAADVVGGSSAVLLAAPDQPLRVGSGMGDLVIDDALLAVARWVADHGRPAGRGTDTLPGTPATCLPLAASGTVVGVLVLAHPHPHHWRFETDDLLAAFTRQTAMAVARARLSEEAEAAVLKARTEEMRSSLLSTVSHDLRTPLASVTGAATTLRESWARIDDESRAELLDTICDEAERLERLVGSLLDMTRLESGSLEVKREWVPVVELVGAALTRLDDRLLGRTVQTDLAAELPLVAVDPVLIEQVLVNLLENAIKYTPAGSPIEIAATVAGQTLVLTVADRGPGLPEGCESRIFEKFFRGPNVRGGGVGLGLSICRGIVEAHGGSIDARNRSEGGAEIRILLPLVGEPPGVDVAEPDGAS